MPYIEVILKNGTKIGVPDADGAAWVSDRQHAESTANVIRLVCRQGDRVLAKFNGEDVSGYVWRDGRLV